MPSFPPSPTSSTAAHPSDTGLFRMAYPYLLVEADEIVDHGYTANLVEATQKLTSADCDPDLRNKVGWGMKKLTLGETVPSANQKLKRELMFDPMKPVRVTAPIVRDWHGSQTAPNVSPLVARTTGISVVK